MKKKLWVVALLAALLAVVATTGSASAHEVRHVGNYTFVVGFLEEPAYVNAKNSIDLTICTGQECTYTIKDGQKVLSNPVADADKTLKAEVSIGSASPLNLPLSPRFGNPGKYSSYFLPNKTGAYTFHISGTINGQNIDEKFTSGPNTFGEVKAVNSYPDTTSNQTQPSNGNALQNQVKEAKDSANTAMIFGIGGGVLGILGLVVAGIALSRKPATNIGNNREKAEQSVDSLRG